VIERAKLPLWGGLRPLVSCLMITQAKRWEHGPPPGFTSFAFQSYEPRELVMVTADPCDAMVHAAQAFHETVRLFDVSDEPPETLGELRQISVECASGELVATWDDDDIHSPVRLSEQVPALVGLPSGDACVLLRVLMDDVARGERFTSPRGPWPQTMVARRDVMPVYRALPTSEDVAALAEFKQVVLLDRPELYRYRLNHGDNVSADAAWAEEVRSCAELLDRMWGGAR
jgi:hypothetical protein